MRSGCQDKVRMSDRIAVDRHEHQDAAGEDRRRRSRGTERRHRGLRGPRARPGRVLLPLVHVETVMCGMRCGVMPGVWMLCDVGCVEVVEEGMGKGKRGARMVVRRMCEMPV